MSTTTMTPSLSRFPNPQIPSRSFFNFTNFPFSLRKSNTPTRVSRSATPMATEQTSVKAVDPVPDSSIKLLFVEMGVGYDQHGQDITSAAMRACRDAISSNSIPAFRRGSIPGVSFGEMKLQIKLGVPRPLHHLLNVEKVKSVFPYGTISNVEVVDGGLICSSGVHVEEMGDKNDDCYIVNAAVYVEEVHVEVAQSMSGFYEASLATISAVSMLNALQCNRVERFSSVL